ncbi:YqaJ-like viral recombinase domain [Popillia japonica]|uniref:YqaJ-like viral recombinase domain n=1 Tax=Popillia japonica TaxID=7064 RepID=A0AAW1I8C4_POPJA
MLYATNIESAAVKFGCEREKMALQKFATEYDISIAPAGLFVDTDYGYIGVSPDGLVGEDALVEVKCSYKLFRSGGTLLEAAIVDRTFCLHVNSEGQLQLKRHHDYYYQIQGQLNVTKRKICYFVIYISDDVPLYVEKIFRDSTLWNNDMLPKIKNFYLNCVLPEIINKNIMNGRTCPHHARQTLI